MAEADHGGDKTILLVEDEAAVRSLVRRALQRHGYTVLDTGEGREAVEIASAHEGPIDLIICDIVLAGMRAESVVARIRERRPSIGVLYVSGYPRGDLALGPDTSFLQKPFSIVGLLKNVRSILDS